MSYMELIDHVKLHPEIWQISHPLFKNKIVRIKFWHRLAKELKADEQQLKKNWKYLADQYRREYKKAQAQEAAVGEPVSSGWAYYEALSFLKAGVASRHGKRAARNPLSSESDNNESAQDPTQAAYTNTSFHNDNDEENSSWQCNPPAKQAKRGVPSKADLILRKLQNLNSQLKSQPDVINNDEDYMFFMSILPSVRTLSPIKKLQLRGKINDWVLEALSERESDPLNNMTQYEMADDVDDKQALRDQIMAAEDDD